MSIVKEKKVLDSKFNDVKLDYKKDMSVDNVENKRTYAKNSLIGDGCVIYGHVENSILFEGVYIGVNSVVKDSVIITNAIIKDNAIIKGAIIEEGAIIKENSVVLGNFSDMQIIG